MVFARVATVSADLAGALAALRDGQRQLDMDGSEVGVSRQALDEVLLAFGTMRLNARHLLTKVDEGYFGDKFLRESAFVECLRADAAIKGDIG